MSRLESNAHGARHRSRIASHGSGQSSGAPVPVFGTAQSKPLPNTLTRETYVSLVRMSLRAPLRELAMYVGVARGSNLIGSAWSPG